MHHINISRTTFQRMCNWKGIQILTMWLISKGLLFYIHPVYPHRAGWKVCVTTVGTDPATLGYYSPMLCQLNYAIKWWTWVCISGISEQHIGIESTRLSSEIAHIRTHLTLSLSWQCIGQVSQRSRVRLPPRSGKLFSLPGVDIATLRETSETYIQFITRTCEHKFHF